MQTVFELTNIFHFMNIYIIMKFFEILGIVSIFLANSSNFKFSLKKKSKNWKRKKRKERNKKKEPCTGSGPPQSCAGGQPHRASPAHLLGLRRSMWELGGPTTTRIWYEKMIRAVEHRPLTHGTEKARSNPHVRLRESESNLI